MGGQVDELSELFGLIRPMYFDIFQEEVKPAKEEKKNEMRGRLATLELRMF